MSQLKDMFDTFDVCLIYLIYLIYIYPSQQHKMPEITAVQLIYNLVVQIISEAQLYYQLQLSLWSYPIALSVPFQHSEG